MERVSACEPLARSHGGRPRGREPSSRQPHRKPSRRPRDPGALSPSIRLGRAGWCAAL